jgi:AcrR family transcriptional regulator
MYGVTTDYTGGGDPQRSMELLWSTRERPRRGPKPKLTVDMIVRTAVAIADADGLAALSMRRVADELSAGPMSLYTYVPGKAELLDVMVDRVCAEAVPSDAPTGSWRERLERMARDNWALYQRHPWLLQLTTARPPLGPNIIAKYEHELRAVDGIGLTDIEMDSVVTLVLGFVASTARVGVEAAQTERQSGHSDDEWWQASAPLLEKVLDPERFPVSTRVGAAAGEAYGAPYSASHAFEFGLLRVLDGIEALVRSRAASGQSL